MLFCLFQDLADFTTPLEHNVDADFSQEIAMPG